MGQSRGEELENVLEIKAIRSGEEENKKSFSCNTGRILDDLADWASKLMAMGEAAGSLVNGENRGGFEYMQVYGETLGLIIKDYAEAIDLTLKDKTICRVLMRDNEDLEKSFFSMSDRRRTLEMISQGAFDPETSLVRAEKEINEVKIFLDNVAFPAVDLHIDLKNLKKAIVERLERRKVNPPIRTRCAEEATK